MAKIPQGDFVPVEHDTFLDIVTNVVGILVILVMLVGLQARDTPPAAASTHSQTASEVAKSQSATATLEQEVLRVRADAQQLATSVAQREMERQYMATLKADAEQQLNGYRSSLDARSRERFDLNRQLKATAFDVEDLDRQRIVAATADGPVVQMKCYPTPLGKTVFGQEVSFQILGGRLTHLPIKELIEDAIAQARQKMWKLKETAEITEVTPPREGFRLRYTIEKNELTGEVRGKQWVLVPTENTLGETIDVALAPGSQFNQILAGCDPQQTTITLWTYPDGFGAYRKLKEELFRRGFATAGRPLPEGHPIGGAPNGTRSTAE